MKTDDRMKNDLQAIRKEVANLLDNAADIPGIGEHSFGPWRNTCEEISRRLSEELLRVAVVGAIKSGKSTFVNALFQKDFLKRGAGVVTSIVTRIRSADTPRVTLFFKSLPEINREIEQALVLFPAGVLPEEASRPDLRNDADRKALTEALARLNTEQLVNEEGRNAQTVLLRAFLAGYDRVRHILSDSGNTRRYEGDAFERHKEFTGDDALSVYLHDVLLEVPSDSLDPSIEIADCQGSDSANPLHLSMIQDYLLKTHLIIYVISGRIGLRRADIRFLTMIRKMGILENTLFLVNLDFSEYDAIADLKAVTRKIHDDLALLHPDPAMFTFSALYNLLCAPGIDLPVKEQLRLTQWRGDSAMTRLSDEETARFTAAFHEKLTRDRYLLLLRNHLERLDVIASGLSHWTAVNRDLVSRDQDGIRSLLDGLETQRKKSDRIRSIVRTTLDGAAQKLKGALRTDIDRFFDDYDGVLGQVLTFIRSYAVPYGDYTEEAATAGISQAMYRVYQDFRRALDGFMTETVNPEVTRFRRDTEARIGDHFLAVIRPYDTLVQDALEEYNQAMSALGLAPLPSPSVVSETPDIPAVADSAGLKVPPGSATMDYSIAIRGEAVMRFGIYRIVRWVKKRFKKSVGADHEDAAAALKRATARLKQETERSVRFTFKDFRENLKHQYLLKLADAVSAHFYETLMQRFEAYGADLTEMARRIGENRETREQTVQRLQSMEAAGQRVQAKTQELRNRLTDAASDDNREKAS